MNQIICPHCGKEFTVDESNYASIVKQIRDHEFSKDLESREKNLKEKFEAEINLVKEKLSNENKASIVDKDKLIDSLISEKKLLESEISTKVMQAVSEKEKELNEKLAKADKLVNELKVKLDNKDKEAKANLDNALLKKDNEISSLTNSLKTKDTEKELAIQKAISELKEKKDSELNDLKSKLEIVKSDYESKLESKDKELVSKQELVDYYKDFKAKQSTKMIGESLEQHCSYEFNKVRMGMFPNAYFEKDNDAKTGSKGDFIFRDYDDEKTEIISIMFEMKNEADTTSTKHKNEDFLKELDKDRNEKGCEYAILVSLLESDNDLYNEGIVDVSYKYPKMYVIRPQFFLPIITLLRNAAINSLSYKKQLIVERNNNLDITHFEENMNSFKDAFSKNYETAAKKFTTAIEEIDKSIDHLQKIKDNLLSSSNQLRLANNKAQDLSIKKLTKDAPSVRAKFEELK